MTDIINLNHQRKAKAKAAKEKQATQNRAKFGRTKAEKQREETEKNKLTRYLDNHKREDGEE